jgi:hypothetical protein
MKGICRDCKKDRSLKLGRCDVCSKSYARHLMWEFNRDSSQFAGYRNKVPKIERFENCTVEVDRARGIITICQGEKIKIRVTRIPLRFLTDRSIDVPVQLGGIGLPRF